MNVVDLFVVISQAFNEIGAGQLPEVPLRGKFLKAVISCCFDEAPWQEELCVWDVLPDVHRSGLAGPVEEVLEEVKMDRLEFGKIVGRRHGLSEQLRGPDKRHVGFGRSELLQSFRPDEISEYCGSGY